MSTSSIPLAQQTGQESGHAESIDLKHPRQYVGGFCVRPAAHVCLCGESPLTAREGEGLATQQSQGGNELMKEADSK